MEILDSSRLVFENSSEFRKRIEKTKKARKSPKLAEIKEGIEMAAGCSQDGAHALKNYDDREEQINQRIERTLSKLRDGKFTHLKLLRSVLKTLNMALDEIRICDQFYGHLFRVWITAGLFSTLSLIYVSMFSGTFENLANGIAMVSCATPVLIPFLAASQVRIDICRIIKSLKCIFSTCFYN